MASTASKSRSCRSSFQQVNTGGVQARSGFKHRPTGQEEDQMTKNEAKTMEALRGHFAVFQRAIATYGNEHQLGMAQEEMGELLAALNQHKRGRNVNVCGEIADVLVMMGQLALMFGPDEVLAEYTAKVARLSSRLDAHAGNRAMAAALGVEPSALLSAKEV